MEQHIRVQKKKKKTRELLFLYDIKSLAVAGDRSLKTYSRQNYDKKEDIPFCETCTVQYYFTHNHKHIIEKRTNKPARSCSCQTSQSIDYIDGQPGKYLRNNHFLLRAILYFIVPIVNPHEFFFLFLITVLLKPLNNW